MKELERKIREKVQAFAGQGTLQAVSTLTKAPADAYLVDAGSQPFLQCAFSQLATHLELIKTWTKTVDLVSEASDELLVERHTLDSVAGLCVLCDRVFCGSLLCESLGRLSGGVVDVGSGAGFPGVVAAVLFPETPVYLVEPRKKRANFLKEVRKELQLKNVSVLDKGIEEVTKEEIPDAKLFLTRAFGKDELFLQEAARLMGAGHAVLFAGPSWEEGEAKAPEMRFVNCTEYELYAGGPKRKIVVWEK